MFSIRQPCGTLRTVLVSCDCTKLGIMHTNMKATIRACPDERWLDWNILDITILFGGDVKQRRRKNERNAS